MSKDLHRKFPKVETQMTEKQLKKYSISLVIMEIQIQNTL